MPRHDQLQLDSRLTLDNKLKKLDFPTLGTPTIPVYSLMQQEQDGDEKDIISDPVTSEE